MKLWTNTWSCLSMEFCYKDGQQWTQTSQDHPRQIFLSCQLGFSDIALTFMCYNPAPCEYWNQEMESLGKCLSWAKTWWMDVQCPYEVRSRDFPFRHGRSERKSQAAHSRRPLATTDILFFEFSVSRTVMNIFLYFMKHWAYARVLLQCELTKINYFKKNWY